MLKKSKYEDTPHLEKDYYITEMHMGDIPGDGYELISTTDYAGPYKTLKYARKDFIKKVCKSKFLKHWDFMIRGPRKMNRHGYKSEWYVPINKQSTIGHN